MPSVIIGHAEISLAEDSDGLIAQAACKCGGKDVESSEKAVETLLADAAVYNPGDRRPAQAIV